MDRIFDLFMDFSIILLIVLFGFIMNNKNSYLPINPSDDSKTVAMKMSLDDRRAYLIARDMILDSGDLGCSEILALDDMNIRGTDLIFCTFAYTLHKLHCSRKILEAYIRGYAQAVQDVAQNPDLLQERYAPGTGDKFNGMEYLWMGYEFSSLADVQKILEKKRELYENTVPEYILTVEWLNLNDHEQNEDARSQRKIFTDNGLKNPAFCINYYGENRENLKSIFCDTNLASEIYRILPDMPIKSDLIVLSGASFNR